jgi:CheY-like chemotaxis protein
VPLLLSCHGHEAMTILIVDDEPSIRTMLGELLEDEGYTTTTAEDGVDALAHLTTSTELPCLILLDVMMPRMNGWELLNALQQHAALKTVPVVILSAQTVQPQNVVTSNVVAHLTKPVNLEHLLHLVYRSCGYGA